jgi:hypothetical protein
LWLSTPEGVDQDVSRVIDVLCACQRAIRGGVLVERVSDADKEYHFQNWFEERLGEAGTTFNRNGRNSYPDILLLEPKGHELKALAYPGRTASFDSNSQVPSGFHNGRTIYYVFGRYPREGGSLYPIIDLIVFHGDFLNAHHDYSHVNRSARGFGTYGDILVRDRKMYVVPSPFALAAGTTGLITLILPAHEPVDDRVKGVGTLVREEAENLLAGYHFDLQTNSLTPERRPNPHAHVEHRFRAYRVKEDSDQEVTLSATEEVAAETARAAAEPEEER